MPEAESRKNLKKYKQNFRELNKSQKGYKKQALRKRREDFYKRLGIKFILEPLILHSLKFLD